MTDKSIPVSPHLRKGKAVRGHNRNVSSSIKTRKSSPSSTHIATLVETEQEKKKTILVDVNGRKADLSKVTALESMDFDGMDLQNYDFSKIEKIYSCYFFETKLSNATFESTNFSLCNFEDSSLKDVSFENCVLENCLFKNVNILNEEKGKQESNWSATEFTACTFEEAELKNVNILASIFQTCTFQGNKDKFTSFDGCTISDSQFHDTDFRITSFKDTIFENSFFSSCTFMIEKPVAENEYSNLAIKKSKIVMVDFFESNLENVNITGSTIKDSVFLRVKGPNLNFAGSTIDNTSFFESDLRETDFSEVTINGCRIEETDLNDSEWERSRVSWGTIFSTGKSYEQYSFEESLRHLDLTEKQFEFLVVSHALEVRDNNTQRIIRSGFDPSKHHLPPWSLENMRQNGGQN